MAKPSPTFDLTCPCCGALMKVDSATSAVISHVAPVAPKTFTDMEAAARSNLKRVSLECGGKSPNIVMGDYTS